MNIVNIRQSHNGGVEEPADYEFLLFGRIAVDSIAEIDDRIDGVGDEQRYVGADRNRQHRDPVADRIRDFIVHGELDDIGPGDAWGEDRFRRWR